MLTRYENARAFGMTSAVLGGGFLLAALTHMNGGLPLGPFNDAPRITSAALFELISGIALCAAAIALFTRRLWAWRDDFGSESAWAVRLGAHVARRGADALWPMVAAR